MVATGNSWRATWSVGRQAECRSAGHRSGSHSGRSFQLFHFNCFLFFNSSLFRALIFILHSAGFVFLSKLFDYELLIGQTLNNLFLSIILLYPENLSKFFLQNQLKPDKKSKRMGCNSVSSSYMKWYILSYIQYSLCNTDLEISNNRARWGSSLHIVNWVGPSKTECTEGTFKMRLSVTYQNKSECSCERSLLLWWKHSGHPISSRWYHII